MYPGGIEVDGRTIISFDDVGDILPVVEGLCWYSCGSNRAEVCMSNNSFSAHVFWHGDSKGLDLPNASRSYIISAKVAFGETKKRVRAESFLLRMQHGRHSWKQKTVGVAVRLTV